MENYSLFAFLLLFLGIGILMSEIVIPSAGLLSFMALACFIGSGICAYNAWYLTGKMGWWWGYVFGIVFIIPSVIAGTLYYLPRTKLGKELFAVPPSLEDLTPFVREEQRLIKMIDEIGTATTLFSPGGMAQVGREKFHAEAEGMLVEPGTEIVVIGVRGNRLLIRPLALHPVEAKIDETPIESKELGSDHLTETKDLEENNNATAAQSSPVEDESTGANEKIPDADTPADSGAKPIDFDIPETA
jgi:membrane-bound serine protease (ClpP class)